jgi:hypothetical protein
VAKLAVELFHLARTVRRRRQRNSPVGMQMVDVRVRKKTVQGSID